MGAQVITPDMILRPATIYQGPTCWTCRHRIPHTEPRKGAPKTGARVLWVPEPMCRRNPIGMRVRGDACQSCGLWELSPAWHSVREQAWEHRVRTSRVMTPGDMRAGCRQATMEDYG